MSYNTISDRHGQSLLSSQETTVSHTRYSFLNEELRDWAANNGVLEEVSLLADTFGASKAFSVVGNLSLELSHPESERISNEWSDDPIVAQLRRLRSSYLSSEEVQFRFPPLSQKGNANRTAQAMRALEADIKNRHFLLLMCVIPLAGHGSQEVYEERRRLRLWLIIQAAKRLKLLDCPSDKLISTASLYVAKDPHDKNWHCIDQLLGRTKQILQNKEANFRSFSLAIERSVLELKSGPQDHGAVLFLNAIAQIAAGDCVPILSHSTQETRGKRPSYNLFEANEFQFRNISAFGFGYQDLETFPASGEPDEDGQQALVFEVESTDSPEEQKLSGRSIAIQSAELSHYLPWSLEKALPGEVDGLETWINDTLRSNLFTEKLGGALVWLAIRFSRSLAQVMQFQISDAQQEEWALTPDFSVVHRQPPRRKHSWYPQSAAALTSVAPFEEQFSFRLPDALRETFLRAIELPTASFKDLRALWFGHASEPLETWFNTQTHGRFSRLSSGKLANIQSQRVYDNFNDHSLARMISAHPRSALPAACGYWNWNISKVESGFALQLNDQNDQTHKETKLLGSLLAPLDSLLNQHIESANACLRDYSGDVIGYHNLLTQYTVTVLYAATGSRHLADPFESASHFCPSPPAVFINDKSDGAIHNGRMVPLPKKAQSFFKAYTIHLAQLAVAIKDTRPELADDIKALPFGKTDRLPLFFLLDSAARWHSASETGLPGGRLFNWPLPSNLFRHRYAQELAREGVHPEVIDGWLGHGERGVGSYGDTSPRCWLNDAQEYQEQTNTVFNRLPFRVQEPRSFPKFNPELDSKGNGYREPQRFGQKERERRRRNQIKKSIDSARDEIRLFLGDRKLEDLEPEQTEKLSNMMLLRDTGLPHTQAAIRLSVLAKQIETIRGSKVPKMTKRLLVFEQDRSLIGSHCPQALITLRRLRKCLDIAKKNTNVTKLSKKEALTLAIVSLMIEKRLTYRRLLSDIAIRENYRIIQHRKRLYLEYSENLEPDNWYAPVERHEIDYKTAALLNYGQELKSQFNTETAAYSEKLNKFAVLLAPQADSETSSASDKSVAWLVESICAVVEQANLVELPGVIAAALSGRRLTTSVPILDHLRLTQGLKYDPPVDSPAHDLPHCDPILTAVWKTHDVSERETLQHNAKRFFDELREQLASYRTTHAIADANRIDHWCKKYPGVVSPAVKLVGHWIAGRIRAGKGRKGARHQPYAESTPKRYLTALSKCFRGLAYDSDLTLLDSDEITDLVEAMLEVTGNQMGPNALSTLQLVEFFTWAKMHGVAEPHWEDLDLGMAIRSAKASLMSEEEYQQCLIELSHGSSAYRDLIPMAQFALILGFRFGLRASEALGLRGKDWHEQNGLRWVLVRRNRLTSLKRPSSRRAVPLLFDLSDQEEMIIHGVALRYESEFGKNRQKHFLEAFGPSEAVIKTHKSAISSMVNSVVKSVTGNPVISFHSTRHSFCTRLSPPLLHHQGILSDALNKDVDQDLIRQLALGPQCNVSRRATMAMARLLGHSTPNTSLRTYNHSLTDWADRLTPVKSMRVHRLSNAVQIDERASEATKKTTAPNAMDRKPSGTEAVNIVRVLRLMSIGRSSTDIETALSLEPTSISDLEELVASVNARMRFSVPDPKSNEAVWIYGSDRPMLLLKKLSDSAWSRLLESAQGFTPVEHCNAKSPLPKIAEIENLVGRNGHLLMSQTKDYALVRLLIDSFCIPEDQFIVRTRNGELGQLELLRRFSFLEKETNGSETKEKPPLDTHKLRIGGGLTNNTSYGGIILSPSSKGTIHNRHELVVALIVVAACYCRWPFDDEAQ